MKRFLLFSLLGFIVANPAAHAQETVSVQVYYESLCPDCMGFFTQQLCPTWNQMSASFKLEFFPYGNARQVTEPSGEVKIQCQHGERECVGNIMHACALRLYDYRAATQFICCTMSQQDPDTAGPPCAAKIKRFYDPVENCMDNSTLAFKLLKYYGSLTDQLNPPHEFVPWILFNNVYNAEDMAQAQDDFKSVLCKHLKPVPPDCNDL